MYIRNVFQFIMENYNVNEEEAIGVWKKSHWYSLFHPVSLLVLIGGLLFRYWVFSGISDMLLLGFVSAQDAFLAAVLLVYIFLWNFFRIKFIKEYLADRKIK